MLRLFVLSALLLSGCATQPVPTSQAKMVPPERIVSSVFLEPKPDTGTLIFKRDKGFSGSGCTANFYVNAKLMAKLDPGEKVILHLPVGDHILSAGGSGSGLCSKTVVENKATVKANETVSYRLAVDASQGLNIWPTAF